MKLSLVAVCSACALTFTAPATAQVLMLDFGPTTASGASLTNSPYHTVNGAFTDSKWNRLGTADVTSGLRWSNDTAATGVSVNLGATTNDTDTLVGLANTPSNGTGLTGSALGGTVLYADSAPGRDGIFTGSNSGNSRFVGAQIGGLAGTYDIYITGRNTNTSAGHVQNFYAGKSSSAGDFDPTGAGFLPSIAITYFASPTTQNNQWTGSGGLLNYAKFTVTLGSGEFLNLAVRGGTGDARGFLNSVQIVNTSIIPEPSAFAALAGAGVLLLALVRRRRS